MKFGKCYFGNTKDSDVSLQPKVKSGIAESNVNPCLSGATREMAGGTCSGPLQEVAQLFCFTVHGSVSTALSYLKQTTCSIVCFS